MLQISSSSLMESTATETDSVFSDPSSTGYSSDLIIPNPKSARLSPSPPPSSSAAPSPKRSRRSAEKRVVSIPISEADVSSRAKGVSECAPPSDSWSWRKYGQKPIKGSPYPRGYYRCSSSKGCPARKQVERSRVDPTTLLVTYTCDHNHTQSASTNKRAPAVADLDPTTKSPPESAAESKFSDLIGPDAFWYAGVGSTSSTSAPDDTLLYGSIFVGCADLAPEEDDDSGNIGGDDVDSALFEGLGELPEYSTVFRRSYWEVHTAVHQ